ncbi:TraR/DksA family transcriptional regulator [Metabacillus halosaccharovorans]|nr:TraR/DksA family transcriptional regulator [Metabacillus halosaccharovorans]MCM3441179.1 TraR/DksA family transcriptional regulator [Metabacillus halosaccharovorans]
MLNKFSGIRYELQVMKEELRARLFDHSLFEMTCDDHQGKSHTLMHHIKEELQDVERALMKIDKGLYGYCEETGEEIPFEKLRILPTARTKYDFFFQELFERKSLPQHDYTHEGTYITGSDF